MTYFLPRCISRISYGKNVSRKTDQSYLSIIQAIKIKLITDDNTHVSRATHISRTPPLAQTFDLYTNLLHTAYLAEPLCTNGIFCYYLGLLNLFISQSMSCFWRVSAQHHFALTMVVKGNLMFLFSPTYWRTKLF